MGLGTLRATLALPAYEVVLGSIGRIKMTFATLFFILAFLFSLYFTATRLVGCPSNSLLLTGGLRCTRRLWLMQGAADQYLTTWSKGGLRRVYHDPASVRICLWLVALAVLAVILTEGQPKKIAEHFLEDSSQYDYLILRTDGGGAFESLIRPIDEVTLLNYFAVAEINRGSVLPSSDAMFLWDAWADYGWLGVVCFPFLAGVAVVTVLSTGLTIAFVTAGFALTPLVSLLFLQPAHECHSPVHEDQEQVPS